MRIKERVIVFLLVLTATVILGWDSFSSYIPGVPNLYLFIPLLLVTILLYVKWIRPLLEE